MKPEDCERLRVGIVDALEAGLRSGGLASPGHVSFLKELRGIGVVGRAGRLRTRTTSDGASLANLPRWHAGATAQRRFETVSKQSACVAPTPAAKAPQFNV